MSTPSANRQKAPKLLAVDLDGTLLNAAGQPAERDVAALKALLRAEIPVTIVTGRLYSGTRPTAMALGIRGPVGCVDGSHVVSAGTHTTIMHHGIKGDPARALRDSLARNGPATFLFARDAIVHDASGEAYLSYVATWSSDVRQASDVATHEFWESDDGLTAIVAVGTVDQISATVDEVQGLLGGAAQIAMFPIKRVLGAWALFARASGGTKGSALAWIAEHHGLSLEECVCVGDWINDLPMFEVAGRSFAMGQAPEQVKKAATDVLEETGEMGGGIARVVQDVFGVRVA